MRLFASLLRREADGEYYLVTPVEKWRIRVERHPLLVIDCEREGTSQAWYALLNTGGHCRIGGANRLHGSGDHGEPFMTVPSCLTAQFTRPAWYRLVAEAQPADGNLVLDSGGESIVLGAI